MLYLFYNLQPAQPVKKSQDLYSKYLLIQFKRGNPQVFPLHWKHRALSFTTQGTNHVPQVSEAAVVKSQYKRDIYCLSTERFLNLF